jgi:uncharacterized protein YprB with RNaseH-like and TPR domain
MPSLSDKLKSLGVKVGARDLEPLRAENPFAIENVVSGYEEQTNYGNAFLVEKRFPVDTRHGCRHLGIDAPLDVIAAWAHEPRLVQCGPDALAFLDTETTGLGFGSGTYAFMVGVARYEGEALRLAQFFMRDPAEEAAMLAALRAFLEPCRGLVTFNGKSFDAPLLNARYRLNGGDSPLADLLHLDLLPLARRLWRDRLVSRALGSLEENVLRLPRTAEDVPGWMIPEMYFDYLRSGDARPLKGIFYHNEIDVLSMAALLGYVADQLANPLHTDVHALDVMAMAKLFESLGDKAQAIALYREAIARGLPKEAHWNTVKRLALIYKRDGAWPQAIELWEGSARAGNIDAHVELAKYYEHKCKAYAQAIHWTQGAIGCINASGFSREKRAAFLGELKHRLGRLSKKSGA